MFLKRIEAIGFKSFAEKTIIEFQKGITAVVGPNGSGKSNISDAIKWVLGEQSSKSLRGDTMVDIIFNGTTERAPLNVAEVTIVLDNTDKALPVEYEEVSITRRLFRSGDSQYFLNKQKVRLKDIRDIILDSGIGSDSLSIISQDKVRAVIEAKSDERRAIIEEAAGVLKYKNRKKETIRNLENTQTNLQRAEDILSELETQYSSLETQCVVAKEYLGVKGQLESIEVALYVRDIEIALKRIKEIEKQMQEQSIQIITYEQMEVKNNQKIIDLNNIKNELDQEINNYQNQIIDVTSKISYIDGQRRALMGNNDASEFENIFRENLSELQKQDARFNNLKNSISDLQTKLGDSRSHLTKLQNNYYQKNSNRQTLQSKIQLLNDFSNSYYGGVKNVLSAANANTLHGIHGTVESLITTEEKYVNAIELALAASAQHIIVNTVNDAKSSIEYLKRGNLGRATFLPIEAMKPRNIDQRDLNNLFKQKGFINTAVNLIKFDSHYVKVMSNLLGNVLICDNLDDATYLSKTINNAYRIITLDGDVIHVGGSMTGGRQEKKTPGLLQQRLQLEEATLALSATEAELVDLEKDIKIVEVETRNYDTSLYSQRIESTRLEEYLRSKHEVIKQLQESLDADNMKDLFDTRDHLNKVLRDLRGKNIAYVEEIQHLERENMEIIRFVRNSTKELHEIDIEKNRIDVRYAGLMDFLTNEYHMTLDFAKTNYLLEMDYEIAKIRVKNLRKHIEGLGNVNVNAIEEFNKVKDRFETLKRNYDDLIKAKDDILSSIKELDEVMVERFKETFDKVNIEFTNVFRQLFNGGNAQLVLEDETDLLNTGIDIIAQPPGTKLNNANLLSGGQKTLTSISLLFAILRVRTVPFCILDECEAALDEANVVRYADYLQKFSDQSQFIVITHRKGTMEKADTLYGVTMQESGVTTIVSVRFEDTDHYIDKADDKNKLS
ncbi:MAG: chromosome segregation protein [Haloplasmataceae bacterium]|nr:chromosome segregation protein [Haloplasmataceae bacterium]